jgi:putative serine protease PepD
MPKERVHQIKHVTKLRRGARSTLAAAAAVAAAALLAACGSGGGGGADSAQTSPITTSRSARSLQAQYVDTIQAVSPSVVQVRTPVGLGSGIVYDDNGDIVTNAHVVGSYKRFQVTDSSGQEHSATLVGVFADDDLAVIRVQGANLTAATFGDSAKLRVGDIVLAVGNPLGFDGSVTDGIVSALGRTVSESNGVALPDLIQTSASINPGNSGGALVELGGSVVGIPTLAAIDSENNQQANGIGFAIPSNTVKEIAGQLIRNGHVVNSNRAYLGVRLESLSSGQGAYVASVTSGGPAANAGITSRDVITAIDGEQVRSVDDVAVVLASLKPGEMARVALRTPRGSAETVTVTLGQYPGS